jgi:hypothetical protein
LRLIKKRSGVIIAQIRLITEREQRVRPALVVKDDVLKLLQVLVHQLSLLLRLDDVFKLLVVVHVLDYVRFIVVCHGHQLAKVDAHELFEGFALIDPDLSDDKEEVEGFHHKEE